MSHNDGEECVNTARHGMDVMQRENRAEEAPTCTTSAQQKQGAVVNGCTRSYDLMDRKPHSQYHMNGKLISEGRGGVSRLLSQPQARFTLRFHVVSLNLSLKLPRPFGSSNLICAT